MTLEKQVISLEIAKRLKELGVKQESLFWYRYDEAMSDEYWVSYWGANDEIDPKRLSAFTVAELGEMLPSELNSRGWEHWDNRLECYHTAKHWEISYQAGDMMATRTKAVTEADARGKMLIYLLENNLMELNQTIHAIVG